ncbi:NinB protein [Variovorax sp. PBS-H4]|uniref:recombination protein NinB n=1 Tax=Variovorax sp. PBS-H4 TaxID=434008 RepID=UPI0013198E0A|nr:recombination protein NinB [Variovorax sp. PBS-H4]VTU38361.1 NinB protein [Variovorax sp. PBS-H4]
MRTFTITDPGQYKAVVRALLPSVIDETQDGGKVELSIKRRRDTKTRLQEEKYHAMIGDIARQVSIYDGRMLPAGSWKRLLVNAFKHDTKDDADLLEDWHKFGDNLELIPALNNPGFVAVGEQTRRFSLKLGSAFIEWLYAFGAEKDVRWSTPKAWGDRPQH